MNIIICDDDKIFLKTLTDMIQKYLSELSIEYTVQALSTLEEIRNIPVGDTDVAILDVNFRSSTDNGILIASELRKKNERLVIVFVSGYLEYAPDGYEVKAAGYYLKNQLEYVFEKMMRKILRELGYDRTLFPIQIAKISDSIYLDEIVYLESRDRLVYLFTTKAKEPYSLRAKLDDIESLLPKEDFIRVHQSFIIRLSCATDYKYREVYFASHAPIPISRARYEEVKNRIIAYRGKT